MFFVNTFKKSWLLNITKVYLAFPVNTGHLKLFVKILGNESIKMNKVYYFEMLHKTKILSKNIQVFLLQAHNTDYLI